MSIDPKFVELTADALEILFCHSSSSSSSSSGSSSGSSGSSSSTTHEAAATQLHTIMSSIQRILHYSWGLPIVPVEYIE